MAERPIFVPAPESDELVREVSLSLRWNSGFAPSQKQKNVEALHSAAAAAGFSPVLEVSSKSTEKLGQHLSAFHLKAVGRHGPIPLESAFQGSKVFEHGGPFIDLYAAEPREAKRDPRLQSSGRLMAFDFEGVRFPLDPRTAFYDWLYITSIYAHREWLTRLNRYAAFSDIEFNPERSVNCQARSCALFVSLMAKGLLGSVESPQTFLATIASYSYRPRHSERAGQQGLVSHQVVRDQSVKVPEVKRSRTNVPRRRRRG